jgi:hypothetical protein
VAHVGNELGLLPRRVQRLVSREQQLLVRFSKLDRAIFDQPMDPDMSAGEEAIASRYKTRQ